ncbi:MAG: hypothetical protein ACK452_08735 [Bacteroidota bacterium]
MAALKLKALTETLNKINFDEELGLFKIEELLIELNTTNKVLLVYEFLLNQQEISPEINLHLKIMEDQVDKTTALIESVDVVKDPAPEIIEEITFQYQNLPPVVSSVEELNTTSQNNNISPGPEIKSESTKTKRKLEISINDKFRIQNELFGQSQQEYNIAIEQLNNIETQKEAEIYLNSLCELYTWNVESPVYKTILRIVHKRFQ